MATQKFDEIVMLVHPLFDLIGHPSSWGLLKNISVNDGKLIFNKNCDLKEVELFKKQISVSLAVYRKTINEYKAPNRFFLIVHPSQTIGNSDLRGFLNKQLVDYAKSKLKDQLLVYPGFTLDYVTSEFKDIIPKFKTKVKIIGFGEWADGCVPSQMRILTKFLVDRNISVVNSEILFDRSIKCNDLEHDYLGKDFKHRIISREQKINKFIEFKRTKINLK